MPSIRKTVTASGAIAVQVVRYEKRKVVVLKHIGSAKTKEEVVALMESAASWIEKQTDQLPLFSKEKRKVIALDTSQYMGAFHMLAYDALCVAFKSCGFHELKNSFLRDFSIMRLIEPASKRRTIELLKRYFGIAYSQRTVYRLLPKTLLQKSEIESLAVKKAKEFYSSNLSVVLYDVTTLYFETFKSDALRKPGFSKDNKPQQPQIVIGLLVTKEGFPLGCEVFEGNTFEGHTMLKVLEAFVSAHDVETPVIVADAAMISRQNVQDLLEKGFSYIVGARMANCSSTFVQEVSKEISGLDGATVRKETDRGTLICAFSQKRYRKDKTDMEKQEAKARILVEKGEPGKRAKFVKKSQKEGYEFDDSLFEKAKNLLGIKGYYTNISEETMSNETIIERYHDLWHVEAAFRMSKHDIQARPIFHHTHDSVKAHILICFVALAVGKHVETGTGYSIRRTVDLLWDITDAHIIDKTTGEKIILRSPIDAKVRKLLDSLGVSY